MTDDNSNLVDMDLDTFSQDFFNPTAAAVEEEKPEDNEEVNENEDDSLATDDENTEDEDSETSEEGSDEDEAEEEEQPKPKGKKSARERIEELYAYNKRLEREIEALKTVKPEAPTEANNKPTDAKPQETAAQAPQPTDLDDDGEPKYKLGEFDPAFIRDLTKFTIAEERKAALAEEQKTAQEKLVEAAQEELKSSWLSKVEEAEKELPDLREHLGQVGEAFAGIDPNYGEFLAATIMSCDFGPQIMYYLSQNIGEAQKIVASGPAAATLAIGRLDAKFTKPAQSEKRNTKKVSNAPNPPEAVNKGSQPKPEVRGDTNDLDAFSREFFGKKK